ncbi:hypothetical protein [Intrasporangium flavum]|uniref:hypothetical protein n=1 Tax=Intrasporangium flavum TaxID=1428657 RepID=UPI00096CEA7A|nr:hypothetical protein [Intrasporangium flavum]
MAAAPQTSPRRQVALAVNALLFGLCLSWAYGSYTRPGAHSAALSTIMLCLAHAPLVGVLLAYPAIRRRAAGIRLFYGLLVVGGLVYYATTDHGRPATVILVGSIIGPLVALLAANHVARKERRALRARRHRDLLEALSRRQADTEQPRPDPKEPRRGSLRSRARRMR